MAESNSVYSPAGFSEFKPSLGFSVDNYGNIDQGHVHEDHRKISFPFEELKPVSNGDDQFVEERETGERNAYWNGMIAGGSW